MKTSPTKIIKSDRLSMLSLVAPIVLIILFIDAAYFGILHNFFSRGRMDEPGDSSFFLIMAIAGTLIFVPMLLLRIKNISNHFKDGVEVRGIITNINFFRDHGRIDYKYEFEGTSYNSGNSVHKSKYAKSLIHGQGVSLIVSKNNPEKAFIKEMYIAE